MPKVTIRIVTSENRYKDPNTGSVSASLSGHVWYELDDGNGNVEGDGFAPSNLGNVLSYYSSDGEVRNSDGY